MACTKPDLAEIVSTTASFKWTRKAASDMFNLGNLLRLLASIVLIYHAVRYIQLRTKQPELFFFGILQLLDIWSRYFLSVREPTQKRTVIFFSFIWSIVVALYAVPLYGSGVSIGIAMLFLVLLAVLVKTTKPVYNCSAPAASDSAPVAA